MRLDQAPHGGCMGERKVEEVIVGGREVRVVHAFDFKATRFFWSDLVKLISFASSQSECFSGADCVVQLAIVVLALTL